MSEVKNINFDPKDLSPREKLLRYEKIWPLFIKFSAPAITGMLVQALYNIVDRIFIGNMGQGAKEGLSGIGVTTPIFFILMGFSMLFGIGAGANISIKMGEGKKETAEKIIGTAIVMLLLSSFLIYILFIPNINTILRIFGATDANIKDARDYITIILFGNLYNTIAFGMNNTIRAEGSPTYSMISMLIGAISNAILDPIFIYTLGMGVKGAAIATIIAQALSTIWCLRYYLSGRSTIKIRKENLKINRTLLTMIVAIGVSPFFIQIAGSVIGALFNNTLKIYGGETGQGAYAIINSITTLIFMPIFGMNQGLQPIIGYNYGAGQFERVKKAVLVGVISSTTVSFLGWLVIQFAPSLLINPMTQDPGVRQMAVPALKRFELVTYVVGFQIISSNFFQSIGKAKISFFLSLSRQIFILVPLLLILPSYMGLMGIWTAMPIADLISTILSGTMLIIELKKLQDLHDKSSIIGGSLNN